MAWETGVDAKIVKGNISRNSFAQPCLCWLWDKQAQNLTKKFASPHILNTIFCPYELKKVYIRSNGSEQGAGFIWRSQEEIAMAYVVLENCIKCKYTDCVEVCPVDCFYEGENMLVIHPDECIDCGVCEPECPAEAIKPDTQKGLETWQELNKNMAKKWPNITVKREALPDAKQFDGKPGKLEAYFSEEPGTGD